jgi:hypothetical protein
MTCEAEFRLAVATAGPPDPERFTVLTRREWYELGEYSCSLPSGTVAGRRWKRNLNAYAPIKWVDGKPTRGDREEALWRIGEYYDIGSKTEIGIRWTIPIVIDE